MSGRDRTTTTSRDLRLAPSAQGAYRLVRAIGWLALLAFGILLLDKELGYAATFPTLSRVTTATVVAAGEPAIVSFTPHSGASPITTTIQPGRTGVILHPGERVSVRYNPAQPAEAAYNGPSGDSLHQSLDPGAIEVSVLVMALAVAGFLAWLSRFRAIRRAVVSGNSVQVDITETLVGAQKYQKDYVRIRKPDGRFDLEWRLVNNTARVTGNSTVLGDLEVTC